MTEFIDLAAVGGYRRCHQCVNDEIAAAGPALTCVSTQDHQQYWSSLEKSRRQIIDHSQHGSVANLAGGRETLTANAPRFHHSGCRSMRQSKPGAGMLT